MRLSMELEYGEQAPRGYGLAWRDYVRGRVVVMPVPINRIVRFARGVYDWVAYPRNRNAREQRELRLLERVRGEWYDNKSRDVCASERYQNFESEVLAELQLGDATGPLLTKAMEKHAHHLSTLLSGPRY